MNKYAQVCVGTADVMLLIYCALQGCNSHAGGVPPKHTPDLV